MKCPALKGKKTCGAELRTRRTFNNGMEVKRERTCPRCGGKFFTSERFTTDIASAEMKAQGQITNLAAEIRELRARLDADAMLFSALGAAIHREGGGKKA